MVKHCGVLKTVKLKKEIQRNRCGLTLSAALKQGLSVNMETNPITIHKYNIDNIWLIRTIARPYLYL
jgi:hypothetical protein